MYKIRLRIVFIIFFSPAHQLFTGLHYLPIMSPLYAAIPAQKPHQPSSHWQTELQAASFSSPSSPPPPLTSLLLLLLLLLPPYPAPHPPSPPLPSPPLPPPLLLFLFLMAVMSRSQQRRISSPWNWITITKLLSKTGE